MGVQCDSLEQPGLWARFVVVQSICDHGRGYLQYRR